MWSTVRPEAFIGGNGGVEDGDCSEGLDGIEDGDPVDGDGSGPRGGVDREGDSNDGDVPRGILVSVASERQMGWRPHSSA